MILRYFRGEGQLLVEVKEIKGLKPAIGRRFTSKIITFVFRILLIQSRDVGSPCPVVIIFKNYFLSLLGAYVKVHLVHGSNQIYENKTKIRRKDFEPKFNQRFLIDVPSSIIEQVNLILRVKDSPYVGRKAVLGEVCIGGDAVGTYFHHWKLALEKDQEIEMWHCLELLNIVPGKTNLETAMKAIPVFESTEEEDEESEDEGLLGMLPNVALPFGMGGLFGGNEENESKKEDKENGQVDEKKDNLSS